VIEIAQTALADLGGKVDRPYGTIIGELADKLEAGFTERDQRASTYIATELRNQDLNIVDAMEYVSLGSAGF